ncbi:DNA topoisomerase [Vibrio harveyi]|uniref:DNA topoisomerase n=1 Tax=Vibrio harveyi TaxID=669 RepID=UPI003CE855F3
MKLLITEKKDVADKLAKAMNWNSGRQCYEGQVDGEKTIVVWARGHLLSLKDPEEISDTISWNDPKTLVPIVQDFSLKVGKSDPTKPDHLQPIAYLNNIKKHFKNPELTEVIIGTDSDREGEAIGWQILEYFNYQGKVRRAWFAKGLDVKSLSDAMKNLRSPNITKSWWRAAESRGRSDWCYMPLVRAYTYFASYNVLGNHLGRGEKGGRVVSVGRVQTPALAMVVDRDLEIENFISKDHFKVTADFSPTLGAQGLLASYTPVVTQEVIDRMPKGVTWEPSKTVPKEGEPDPLDVPLFTGKAEVDAFQERLKSAYDRAVVHDYKEGSRKENPPKTFALSQAQNAIASACNISAPLAQTILEDLYEQGWTSYARTSKQELPENYYQASERNAMLDAVTRLPEVTVQAEKVRAIHGGKDSQYKSFMPSVFTKKALEHHGIIPTTQVMTPEHFAGLTAKKMSGKNVAHTKEQMQKAYLIVVKQFIQALYPPAQYATQEVQFMVPVEDMLGDDKSFFKAKGERITDKGWRAAFGDSDKNTSFPFVNKGDSVFVGDVYLKALQTKPPTRYTEVNFPLAMENVAKTITDPKYRKLLRKSEGIGTPATRSEIMRTLVRREYLEIKKGVLYSTPKGRDLIKFVPEWLKSPAMTAAWEDYLIQICDERDDAKCMMMRDEFNERQKSQVEKLITGMINKFDGNLGERVTNAPKSVTDKMKKAIRLIAEKNGLSIPRGTLTDPVKAKAWLDEHAKNIDTTPSEGQLKFLDSIIPYVPEGTEVPENVRTDRRTCSLFIDKYKEYADGTPSEKQMQLAREISTALGIPLDSKVETSRNACSKFIDENMSKVDRAPTDAMVNYLKKLAASAPPEFVMPENAYTSSNVCREMIEKLKGEGNGGAGTGRAPSEKQLKLLNSIISNMPDAKKPKETDKCFTDAGACSKFIDKNKGFMPKRGMKKKK